MVRRGKRCENGARTRHAALHGMFYARLKAERVRLRPQIPARVSARRRIYPSGNHLPTRAPSLHGAVAFLSIASSSLSHTHSSTSMTDASALSLVRAVRASLKLAGDSADLLNFSQLSAIQAGLCDTLKIIDKHIEEAASRFFRKVQRNRMAY